ncbi:MAG: quinoprotein dehydrogenase-associated SoxYZ-like carrier [Gammaproteobacteria bacterium]
MKSNLPNFSAVFMMFAITIATSVAYAEESKVDVWEAFLKPKYFENVKFIEDSNVIELKTPYRAEDASVTPVSIKAAFPQSEERSIDKIYMFVDENPQPLVGIFHLTKDMGRADLAMRIRVDKYTNVRAIAVLNNGEHHMVTNFVKAQGGCSAPLAADYKKAMEKLGTMKFKTVGDVNEDRTMVGQFLLSHPNVTGMQKDQKTQLFRPAHYVEKIKIFYNDKHIMTAETGFSVSADPSFRFFFRPQSGGELRAEVVDSKGNEWTQKFSVET